MSHLANPTVTQTSRFKAECDSVLEKLRARYEFQLWIISRTDGLDCIILNALDLGYGFKSGQTFRWLDTLSARAVRGEAPSIAPCTDNCPAYMTAPMYNRCPIKSFIAVSITDELGNLIGTVSAADPNPMDPKICKESRRIESEVAKIRGAILDEICRYEMSQDISYSNALKLDPIFGFGNTESWHTVMDQEEFYAQSLGNSLAVGVIRLVPPYTRETEALACQAIRSSIRSRHPVARTAPGEFSMILTNCSQIRIVAISSKIRQEFQQRKIGFEIGFSKRNFETGVIAAWHNALIASKMDSACRLAA